jgi:predicted lysophospholipase L1 biosynthesis ABC-type transport system permease subunit
LRAIGGKPVEIERYEDERARRLAGREFHLTWAADLPHDDRVLAGRWWGSRVAREFSVETELPRSSGSGSATACVSRSSTRTSRGHSHELAERGLGLFKPPNAFSHRAHPGSGPARDRRT